MGNAEPPNDPIQEVNAETAVSMLDVDKARSAHIDHLSEPDLSQAPFQPKLFHSLADGASDICFTLKAKLFGKPFNDVSDMRHTIQGS